MDVSYRATIADFDGDGDPDMAVTSQEGQFVYIATTLLRSLVKVRLLEGETQQPWYWRQESPSKRISVYRPVLFNLAKDMRPPMSQYYILV